MRFGLDEEVIERIQRVLAKYPCVERAVLYGSRAKGSHKPGSDIDLNLQGEGISAKERDKILWELDDLNLPYGVDVTVLNEISHAKLLEHIRRVGVVFYERGGKYSARSSDVEG